VFERGFKSWCENVAIELRKELKLDSAAPLPPTRVADHLGIGLWTPHDLEGLSRDALAVLLGEENDSWSAITVAHSGRKAIVYNPRHSAARRASDVMHELAHVIIGHQPERMIVSSNNDFALRTYDKKQEDEAIWLSGSLLLPRGALLEIVEAGVALPAAANQFGVSLDLLEYRINITAVRLQLRRRRRR